MPDPITHFKIGDHPADAIPSRDGCWLFVSVGRDSGSSGIALLRRTNGKLEQVRFVPIPGAPFGMVLTHDEKMLIVAAGTQVAFLDVSRLISGQADAVVGYIGHLTLGGAVIVNVTSDDQYLFISQETAATISVVDLRKARASGFNTEAIIGGIPTGRAPVSLVFSPTERYLYATSQEAPPKSGWPITCHPGANPAAHPDHTPGAILVIDVERAKSNPESSVIASVQAGCNPVRLVLSPDGNTAYVSARTDNQLLVFDTRRIVTKSANALIGRVPVGAAPVGVAVIDDGKKVVVTNSNRFAGRSDDKQDLTVIDAAKVANGASAVLGTIPAGAFPRQLQVTTDGRTLLLTNYASGTLQIIDLERLSLDPIKRTSASPPAIAEQPSGYPITEYLGMTLFPEVQVSPDARHVAFITAKNNFATDRNETTIWIIDVDAQGRKTGIARLTDKPGDFSDLKWSSDGRYLAYKSALPNSKPQLVVLDIKSNKLFLLTTDRKFRNGITAFDWSPDGRRIYFSVNDVPPPKENNTVSFPQPEEPDDHSTFYRLATADFGKKGAHSFVSIEDTVVEFALSPDEKTIAIKPFRGVFLLDITGKQPYHRLTPPFPCFDPGMKWTSKGIVVQVCAGIKDGKMVRTQRRIYWVDPANGHMEQVAPDFTGELWAQGGTPEGGVLAIGNVSTKWGLYYIDALTRKAQEVESGLGAVRRVSVATSGNLIAFSTVNNPELYIASGINRMSSATKMTDFNAKLSQMPKSEVETVGWNNYEGDVIEGVLYYPPGKKGAKNLPFILYIHGGPWTARTESFYVPLGVRSVDEAALLASRGYLVLMPNYRGSTGRGDAFLQALNGYPCSRPSTDVLTGVDYVVAKGWADPERLGVMGSSYGGQITNCVIGLTNRFKAAASTSGFWNLISAFEITNGKPPWEDMKMYWEESAISRAANIKTPTIITIGAADERVNPAQAREQQRALNWLRVPNELLMFPGEGHNFSKPSNQRIRLEAEIAWLDHYILGKPLPKPK